MNNDHQKKPVLANVSAQQVCAWAYDRQNSNRRPIFKMIQEITHGDVHIRTERQWQGVGEQVVCQEKAVWTNRLTSVASEMPFIAEQTHAEIKSDHCATWLKSQKTQLQQCDKSLTLPHEPVTLATVPLMIAREWNALQNRQGLMASYLVLKVQRAATVRIQCTKITASECTISVTPTNVLLRAIFGSTLFVFEANSPRLLRVEGVLDPRDTKPNKRWREYMGSIEFESPFDLSALVKGKSA